MEYKLYAPYSYLSFDEAENTYHLFLAVPIALGDILIFPEMPSDLNGLSQINILIVSVHGKKSSLKTIYRTKHYAIPIKGDFNPSNTEIAIHSAVLQLGRLKPQLHFTSILKYEESDFALADEESQKTGICYNSPYVFLDTINEIPKEEDLINTLPNTYQPYLLIPTRGYELLSKGSTVISNEKGNIECFAVLTKKSDESSQSASSEAIFFPQNHKNFNLNSLCTYPGATGHFTVNLLLDDNPIDAEEFLDKPLETKQKILFELAVERLIDRAEGNTTQGISKKKRKKKKASTSSAGLKSVIA